MSKHAVFVSRMALIAAGMLIAPGSLQAAEQQASDAAGNADSGPVDIVVTAQHRNERLQDVPISIQALSSDALKDLGVKSTADISQFTPNVVINSPAGAGVQPIITIRGIGLADFNSNNAGPNGVYVDDFYISSPTAQSIGLFDLERVEVLKGPQGTLYGRNSSGGAINLITAKPTDEFAAKAHLEYSSFDTFAGEAAVGGPITGNLDGRISGMFNNSDGFFHNTLLGTRENGTNTFAGRAQLLLKPDENLDILLKFAGARVDTRPNIYRHYGVLDPASVAAGAPQVCSTTDVFAGNCVDAYGYGTPSDFYSGQGNRRQKLKVTDLMSTLRADYRFGSDITLTSITGWNYNKKFHPEDSDASPFRLVEATYGARSTEVTQELRLAQNKDRYNWVVGLYYIHENLKQDQTVDVLLDIDNFTAPGFGDGIAFTAPTNNRQITKAGAMFGQLEYKVTDKLKLIAGARYTREHKSFTSAESQSFQSGGIDNFAPPIVFPTESRKLTDSKFNWRLGLNYNFTPAVMVYTTAATGFKSGGFNGGFLSQDPAERARQLQPIKPETVTSFEVGLKSEFLNRRVTLNLAAFYNDYRNQQVFLLANIGGTPVNVLDNAKKARTYGLDAELTVRPVPELTLSAQAGLLRTKLVEYVPGVAAGLPDYSGNQLAMAPKTTLSLTADWRHPVGPGEFGIQLNANYRSHQYFDNSNDPFVGQDGYWLENLRVSYGIKDSRWEIAGFVRNLSDKKYLTYISNLTTNFGLLEGMVGTPRSYGVELNCRY